jgi:hypothetical protein
LFCKVFFRDFTLGDDASLFIRHLSHFGLFSSFLLLLLCFIFLVFLFDEHSFSKLLFISHDMSKELVSILFWIKVDPIRITIIFFVFSYIFLFSLVPVFLSLLTRAIVGISLRHSTSWFILKCLNIYSLDQLSLLPEWNLWSLIEHIIDTHVVIIEQVKVDRFLLDESTEQLALVVLDSPITTFPKWLLFGCI